jgi:hypothetical protein
VGRQDVGTAGVQGRLGVGAQDWSRVRGLRRGGARMCPRNVSAECLRVPKLAAPFGVADRSNGPLI